MADITTGGDGGGSVSNNGGGAAASGNPAAGSGTQPTGGAPTPIDLDENALIRVKGSDKPVKFGDHVKGFQSQFTKASQEAARLKKELETIKQQQQQAQRQQQQGGREGQPDVYDALRQLPYLTGEDAVNVVQSISSQIAERDHVLVATLRKLGQMEKVLNTLNSSYRTNDFEGYLSKTLKELGYDDNPAYLSLANEIYRAYEGDDLREAFPRIFSERLQQIEAAIEARRKAKIDAARRQPFVPGRGGQANPSKPLQIRSDLTSRQYADELFKSFGEETVT